MAYSFQKFEYPLFITYINILIKDTYYKNIYTLE